jgi:copper resistance protein C
MTLSRTFCLIVPAFLLASPPVWAHSVLERASPAVGSIVRSTPSELSLRFTEDLEAAFSTLHVIGSDGERADVGVTRVDEHEKRILRASLKPLKPGIYKVIWRAVSIDTHVTNGDFTFTVTP